LKEHVILQQEFYLLPHKKSFWNATRKLEGEEKGVKVLLRFKVSFLYANVSDIHLPPTPPPPTPNPQACYLQMIFRSE